MKDLKNRLDDDTLAGLFRDETPLPEVPARARKRVMDFIRQSPDRSSRTLPVRFPRRLVLWPALGLAAAALVVGAVLLLPLLRMDGGETAAAGTAVTDRDLARGVIEMPVDRALLVYCSGRVEISSREEWAPAALGGFIARGQRLRVGPSSSCQIQFGDRAVVVVEENTELSVGELMAQTGRTDIELGLASGSVLCAVKKLMPAETFQVKTRTAICGVRGTDFRVEVTGAEETVVSVKEGVVYTLPPDADIGLWRRRLAKADQRIGERIDRLRASAPAVTAGRQAVLTAEFPAAAKQAVSAWESELNRAASLLAPTADDLARLDAALAAFLANLKGKTPVTRKPSLPREGAGEAFHKPSFLPVAAASTPSPTTSTTAAAEPTGPALVKIELLTMPEDAAIILSGREVGRGLYRAIVPDGVRLDFIARREGYEEAAVAVTAAAAGNNTTRVELKKRPAPETAPSPSTEPTPRPDPASILPPNQLNGQRGFTDDFDGPALDQRWSWVRESPGYWSLKTQPGTLTITTQRGGIRDTQTSGQNLLLCPADRGDFQLDTKIEFRPKANWQQAGLILYRNDDNFVKLDFFFDSKQIVEMGHEIAGVYNSSFRPFTASSGTVFLRVIRRGDMYSGYYSEDGKNYTFVERIRWVPGANLRVGLLAANGNANADNIPASFDYFKISYGAAAAGENTTQAESKKRPAPEAAISPSAKPAEQTPGGAVRLELQAKNATLAADGQIRLEEGEVRMWSSLKDQVKWEVDVPLDGEYEIWLRYSCYSDTAGSTVRLTIGGQSLDHFVRDTGNWINIEKTKAGRLKLKAGKQALTIQATSIRRRYIMNLSEVILEKK